MHPPVADATGILDILGMLPAEKTTGVGSLVRLFVVNA
jgi:hypothetical protein